MAITHPLPLNFFMSLLGVRLVPSRASWLLHFQLFFPRSQLSLGFRSIRGRVRFLLLLPSRHRQSCLWSNDGYCSLLSFTLELERPAWTMIVVTHGAARNIPGIWRSTAGVQEFGRSRLWLTPAYHHLETATSWSPPLWSFNFCQTVVSFFVQLHT